MFPTAKASSSRLATAMTSSGNNEHVEHLNLYGSYQTRIASFVDSVRIIIRPSKDYKSKLFAYAASLYEIAWS